MLHQLQAAAAETEAKNWKSVNGNQSSYWLTTNVTMETPEQYTKSVQN